VLKIDNEILIFETIASHGVIIHKIDEVTC